MSELRHATDPEPVVILAEDDADMREPLAELLAADGYVVEPVRDGSELSTCLERRAREGRPPAMIVTDHRMPGSYVFDVLDELGDALDRPPVIVITAFADEVTDRARRWAKAVFRKPFDPDDLRTAVLHWMKHAPERPVDARWRTRPR